MNTVDVITEIFIDRSVEQVATYAADPGKAPEWYVNIKTAEWKSPKPLAEGSLIAFKARFLGRQLSYTYEIVEYIPMKRLVMRTADGPFPMETIYAWEAVGDARTRMTLRNHGKPSGFSKLFAPFMAPAMRKANEKDLRKLKEILEN